MRERDHHVLRLDEVFGAQVEVVAVDLGAARIAVRVAHFDQLVADHLRQTLGPRENVPQIADAIQQLFVFGDDLVLLEAREAVQAHVEDGLGLRFGQVVAAAVHAELGARARRAASRWRRRARAAAARCRPARRAPEARPAPRPSDGAALMSAMTSSMLASATARPSRTWARSRALRQIENGAARDDLAAVAEEGLEHLLERHELRLAVLQRDHVDAEHGLHRRLREEVVEHDFGDFAALQLDDDAHAVLVGLVADLGDAVDVLVAHQVGDALVQARLVHLVRQLGDDDGLALALADVLEVRARADRQAAAARCDRPWRSPARR